MTYALNEIWELAQMRTIVLLGCVSVTMTREEGGRNPKNFAYVICTCHLASCLFLCKVAIAPAKAPHARAHCGVAGKRALCYAVFHPRPANCARTSLYGGYYGPSFLPLQDLCLVSEVYACVWTVIKRSKWFIGIHRVSREWHKWKFTASGRQLLQTLAQEHLNLNRRNFFILGGKARGDPRGQEILAKKVAGKNRSLEPAPFICYYCIAALEKQDYRVVVTVWNGNSR